MAEQVPLGPFARSLMERRAPHRRTMLIRLGRFLAVGGSGVVFNSVALFILYQHARLPLLLASALAVEVAIVSNFIGNSWWTFDRRAMSLWRFAKFNAVSLGGLAITTATLWSLVTWAGLHYLMANLIGIALATTWNFTVNLVWTWGWEP